MDETYLKRLAVIKQLYKLGLNQSYDSEPMNGFCLLSFHDSVEMFMKLCCEINGIRADRNTIFLDYFSKLPTMEGVVTMGNLNNKRVALKHHGNLPSKLDVEVSRVNVIDFFNKNTPIFFNISFDEISLVSLIKYDSVRVYLDKSLFEMKNDNFSESIIQSQIAFKELLFSYEDEKKIYFKSPFKICEDFTFYRPTQIDSELDKNMKKIVDSLENLDDIIKILGFGLDYKKYVKFKILRPYIQVWHEKNGREYEHYLNNNMQYDLKNAQFCFDFVIESALKLQEFDFEINEVYK